MSKKCLVCGSAITGHPFTLTGGGYECHGPLCSVECADKLQYPMPTCPECAALTARVEELEDRVVDWSDVAKRYMRECTVANVKLTALGLMAKTLPDGAWGAFPEDIVPEIQAEMERILASEPEVIAVVPCYMERDFDQTKPFDALGGLRVCAFEGESRLPATVTVTRKEIKHE